MIDKETQRLASIFDAMGRGVYIIEDDYTVKFMNKASISAFGEGIGKKCYQAIANRDEICPWCRAKEVFEGETLRWENYFAHIDKTFEIFELPLQTVDGTISHFCIYRDITEIKEREKMQGEPFREFTFSGDYLPYVDGKPRYKGVDSFLKSRGINIPFGDPSDSVDSETCCGLGNRKNIVFNEVLSRDGVEVFQSTVDLIHELIERGIRIGVASSSKNCKSILESAKLGEIERI